MRVSKLATVREHISYAAAMKRRKMLKFGNCNCEKIYFVSRPCFFTQLYFAAIAETIMKYLCQRQIAVSTLVSHVGHRRLCTIMRSANASICSLHRHNSVPHVQAYSLSIKVTMRRIVRVKCLFAVQMPSKHQWQSHVNKVISILVSPVVMIEN